MVNRKKKIKRITYCKACYIQVIEYVGVFEFDCLRQAHTQRSNERKYHQNNTYGETHICIKYIQMANHVYTE